MKERIMPKPRKTPIWTTGHHWLSPFLLPRQKLIWQNLKVLLLKLLMEICISKLLSKNKIKTILAIYIAKNPISTFGRVKRMGSVNSQWQVSPFNNFVNPVIEKL
jgi:hypothetical protein